jgi:hypothetical protein
MEKSPVVIALLTMMMVKSVNSRIDSSRHEGQRAQPETSSYDPEKFRQEDRMLTQRRASTGLADQDVKK